MGYTISLTTVEDGLRFLTQVYAEGGSYSSVNAAKVAISAIMPPSQGIQFSKLPVVIRFMRGVSN